MSITDTTSDSARLTTADLVPDEPLGGTGKKPIADSEDLLQHRVIARKVAELATSANGKVNIALFGPWGAGKSSFNSLLAEELAAIDPNAQHVTFDAWKNAGQGFRTNFLSELAQQIPKADRNISDQLFQGTTRVTFPLAGRLAGDRGRNWLVSVVAGFLLSLFVIAPLLWTVFQNLLAPVDDFLAAWWTNIAGWAGIAVSSTLLVVVATGLIELSKVTVSKSTPSHVAQFGALFDKLLSGKNRRFVVFIDELDRCGEDDVMATLEGLRTFLGHERCVFVVAFDRDAIATTIAKQIHHNVPTQASSPYYRTSGEYLDKIFQFQLSLPPQPAHTFRRYALSLVAERGGVWAATRDHRVGLLDRVITVLSPMHLASPRRTKVLLNDFAVNMRIYQSLGFDWLDRAEEIAVLTVLQTEFPNLMADVERAPSLMRFLYRQETPKRSEVSELLAKYQQPTEPDASGSQDDEDGEEVPLDRIVGSGGEDQVARDLHANLGRYLRRLREMDVPEPKADLIMMHSDKALLHFEDPGVYHEVLLAADTSRKDVLEALGHASPSDRSLAIDHVLEQAERESTEIALNLRVLAGELAAGLPQVSPKQADHLRSAMSRGLSGHGRKSLEGYARAVAASYTKASATRVLAAAEARSGDALGAVASHLADELAPKDWAASRQLIASRVLPKARELPNPTARILRRMAQDLDFELDPKQIAPLAASLSVVKPSEVDPATATTAAARQEAEEQNTRALEAYEQEREEVRSAASILAEVWSQLPEESRIRHGVLRVFRTAKDGTDWYLALHDRLIVADINSGSLAATNSYLLDAIAELPHEAASRWRNLLSDDAPVNPVQKADALAAVVNRATSNVNAHTRTNAAGNAYRIAALPSEPVPAGELLSRISDDIDADWEEYSDSRFEYQLQLLAAIDLLNDDEVDTTPPRANLFLCASTSAQEEQAAVNQIVSSVKAAAPDDAVAVSMAFHEARPWDEDFPQYPLLVALAAQDRALSEGKAIETIPAAAILRVEDPAVRKLIADQWLATAPPLASVEALVGTVPMGGLSWRKYGERVSPDQRAATWHLLTNTNAPVSAIRSLSTTGQPLEVYEAAAASVRDAKNRDARLHAVDRFLALPVAANAAGVAQALVKTMAADAKRTELPLGVRLMRAYAPHWSRAAVAALQPTLTPWVEASEAYLPRKDLTWLVNARFLNRKSTIWEQMFRSKGK